MPHRRLGRAILRIHQHDRQIHAVNPVVAAQLDGILLAGRAMDFAARLREYGDGLTASLVHQFALQTGIGLADLRLRVLPMLKAANVVDFAYQDNELKTVEEFVGVASPFLDQVVSVFEGLPPSNLEWAVLYGVELATWAPLTRQDHLHQLTLRDVSAEVAETATALCLASQVNARVKSAELNDDVIYSPYSWGSEAVEIATFLRRLPAGERDVLVGICEAAIRKPGLAVGQLGGESRILKGAQKVGLLQTATVKSTSSPTSSQTYAFSPLLEVEDDLRKTTEVLHERKLFVAHIMFGHEKAVASHGRILSPVVLVNALLRTGEVGPASNIGTDYHMLEAAGIVRVDHDQSRPYLHLVKREVAEEGLEWLRRTSGSEEGGFDPVSLGNLRPPDAFVGPEENRVRLPDDAAATEVFHAAVLELRKEAGRAARHEGI